MFIVLKILPPTVQKMHQYGVILRGNLISRRRTISTTHTLLAGSHSLFDMFFLGGKSYWLFNLQQRYIKCTCDNWELHQLNQTSLTWCFNTLTRLPPSDTRVTRTLFGPGKNTYISRGHNLVQAKMFSIGLGACTKRKN